MLLTLRVSSQSDYVLTADQDKLQNRFQFIFEAMGQLGQDVDALTDCSDVLPIPPALKTDPHFPAGKTLNDVEQAVRVAPSMWANTVLT